MKNSPIPLFIASLLLILLDIIGIMDPVKDFADRGLIPVKQILYRAGISLSYAASIIYQYDMIKTTQQDMQNLTIENTSLTEENTRLKEENLKLRTQLDAPLPASYQFLPAKVLGLSRFMDIAAGSRNGVTVGLPVVVGEIFIGRIYEVTESRSSVMLTTDTQLELPAKTNRGAHGILSGQFGEGSVLGRVLQKDPLFLGDTAYTESSQKVPVDLIIGTITHINVDDAAVYKQAKVNLFVDYRLLRTVFVITHI